LRIFNYSAKLCFIFNYAKPSQSLHTDDTSPTDFIDIFLTAKNAKNTTNNG